MFKKRYISFLLAWQVLVLVSCKKDDPVEKILDNNLSAVSKALLENSNLVSRVFTDTVIQLHPGVQATEIHYLSMEGYSMRAFVLEADMKQSGIELRPLTPFGSTGFARQTVPEMLKYVEAPAKPLAATNADFSMPIPVNREALYI
jgi:hypothetical protein